MGVVDTGSKVTVAVAAAMCEVGMGDTTRGRGVHSVGQGLKRRHVEPTGY
jgi:hypothetical protein